MVELVTNRITAQVLWIPKAWAKHGLNEKDIETAVVSAVHLEKDEIRLDGKDGQTFFFFLYKAFLESKPDEVHGMVEINEFTLNTMTRHYVSLSQIP